MVNHPWSTTLIVPPPPPHPPTRPAVPVAHPPTPFYPHRRVNQTIFEQGFAVVRNLQLLAVTFKPNYEETITNIQLQEQLKVTKSYTLDVTRVLKEVDVLPLLPVLPRGMPSSPYSPWSSSPYSPW